MKKIIKLFCIVSCLMVCFAGCGKGDDKASYNAQDVRAYLETQVADISKGEEEPVDDETATFKKEEGMYKSAVESWNKLADECGKATDSVSVDDLLQLFKRCINSSYVISIALSLRAQPIATK